MSGVKHTPGPWKVGGRYASKTVLLNAKGQSIASGGNNRWVKGAELEASLILAAEAPNLLKVLRECAEALAHCMGPSYEPVIAANIAIYRALGGGRES